MKLLVSLCVACWTVAVCWGAVPAAPVALSIYTVIPDVIFAQPDPVRHDTTAKVLGPSHPQVPCRHAAVSLSCIPRS
jgi:hypothetical protein